MAKFQFYKFKMIASNLQYYLLVLSFNKKYKQNTQFLKIFTYVVLIY